MDKSQTQDNSYSRRRGPHQQEQKKASLIVKTGLSRSKKQTENQTHRVRNSLCHVIATTTKVQNKQSILKAARRKSNSYTRNILYKGSSIRIGRFFSSRTLETRREWTEVLQIMKYHRCKHRILCLLKLSISHNRRGKEILYDKNRCKVFMTTKLPLYNVLQ